MPFVWGPWGSCIDVTLSGSLLSPMWGSQQLRFCQQAPRFVVCSLVIILLGLAAPVTQITVGPRSPCAETELRESVGREPREGVS